jgi:hypothetical protein
LKGRELLPLVFLYNYCQQDLFGGISQCSLGHWKTFANICQNNLSAFSDCSGFNLPVATFLSDLGSCHKMFDMFSCKIVRLGGRETGTMREKNNGFGHWTIDSSSISGSPICSFYFSTMSLLTCFWLCNDTWGK